MTLRGIKTFFSGVKVSGEGIKKKLPENFGTLGKYVKLTLNHEMGT